MRTVIACPTAPWIRISKQWVIISFAAALAACSWEEGEADRAEPSPEVLEPAAPPVDTGEPLGTPTDRARDAALAAEAARAEARDAAIGNGTAGADPVPEVR